MFNHGLKKEALHIHEESLKKYNDSYDAMSKSCNQLYDCRVKVVELIKVIQDVVNSIANTPKDFEAKLTSIKKELTKFTETEEYAKKAYDASIKAGVNILGGAATGIGVASMAPTALMSIATTFGTASTGTAISALSGAAAQKAAAAWIGRTFAGFAIKEGAGMAAGQAFLALAGPIGWGITAVSTGVSLISLSNKNKKISDEAVEEAKKIEIAREAVDETHQKISSLKDRTETLYDDLNCQRDKITSFKDRDFMSLLEADKLFLGTLVNNTLSLSVLLNEKIE